MKPRSVRLLLATVCATLASCGTDSEFPREISEQLSAFQSHTKWLKELPGPDGATIAGFGGGAAADYRFWNVQVVGAVSRDEVLAYYAGELSGLGWRLLGGLQDEPVAIRSFHFLDEEERPWHGLLTVADGVDEADHVNVMIRVSRITSILSILDPEPSHQQLRLRLQLLAAHPIIRWRHDEPAAIDGPPAPLKWMPVRYRSARTARQPSHIRHVRFLPR